MKFCFKTAIGIGDLIYVKAMLDATKGRFSQIVISPDRSLVSGRDDYLNFIFSLMKLIFDDDFYQIVDDQSLPFLNIRNLWRNHKFKVKEPDITKQLCLRPIPEEYSNLDYCVLSTKVRTFHLSKWNTCKDSILDAINSLPSKIILMGEKEVEYSPEYLVYGEIKIYSIYNDVISRLDNVIDLTVPKLGLTTPSLENILKDCSIMRGAKKIFTVGGGGGFCLATGIGNAVSLVDLSTLPIVNSLVNEEGYLRSLVTDDLEKYLDSIKS